MYELTELANIIQRVSLEPSWLDYTLLVVTSLATTISVIAIIVAINVPKKIAKEQNKISHQQTEIVKEQNKIALFEKKFDVYKAFIDLESYCSFMEKRENMYLPIWRLDIIHFLSIKQVNYEAEDHKRRADTFRAQNIQLIYSIKATELFFSLSEHDITIIEAMLSQYKIFCNSVVLLDSFYTNDEELLGNAKATEFLRISKNEHSEIFLHDINRKELNDQYTDHRNTLIEIFDDYEKADIRKKLLNQLKLTSHL